MDCTDVPHSYHNTLNAIVYYKTSGECLALYIQTFALAKLRLKARLDTFLASGGDISETYVISDLDETLLDNSPIRRHFIQSGQDFDPATWSTWCQSKQAIGTPGAKDFVDYASSLGVTVVYVTSRIEQDRLATAQTLQVIGLALPDGSGDASKSCLFMSGMILQPGGGPTKKGAQYAFLAQRFGSPPLLQLGDNLSDHDAAAYADSVDFDVRYQRAIQEASRWGNDRIVFPNPVYGGWENSLRITTGAGTVAAVGNEGLNPPNPPAPVAIDPNDAPKLALIPDWVPN
jgi:5'-nucleotidase (lipoprotein e(P4) family)